MTQRDEVLAFVRQFPGRDDDEIAAALRLSQRQTVNIICRQLEMAGVLSRKKGPLGKLVNMPATPGERSAAPLPRVPIKQSAPAAPKARLTVGQLSEAGFRLMGQWVLGEDGGLILQGDLPKIPGVYAFADGDRVLYVGVATISLAKRLYFYKRPGASQRTNVRVNALLRDLAGRTGGVGILTASPPASSWNGLPVHGAAGLEIGLIEAFGPPWNKRSVVGRPLEDV